MKHEYEIAKRKNLTNQETVLKQEHVPKSSATQKCGNEEIRKQLANIEAASSGHETVSSDRYRSYYACLFIVFRYSPLLCINSSYFIFGNSNSIILANITFAHVPTSYFWALSATFVQMAAFSLLEKCYRASNHYPRKVLPRTDSNHTTIRIQTISSCVI